MCIPKNIDLNIDVAKIKNSEEYHKCWDNMGKIEVTMIEKNENCKHAVGDRFVFDNPYSPPVGLCHALVHVLNLYTWRVALGFPSWYDDRTIHKIHCPDARGTVWTMKKLIKPDS